MTDKKGTTAIPYRAFGESLVLQDGTAALEDSRRKGPATGVEWNPATGRLELVRIATDGVAAAVLLRYS